MNRTIGIDLGTTNSAGVVLKDGKIRMVPSEDGPTPHGKMLPSIVAFKHDGGIVVGEKAKMYSHTHPERVVRWIKRKMGTNYKVNIDGIDYTPQEISSFLLKRIKNDAERYLGEKINQAVITAPAYFNNNQRNATKQAGELAGFEVLRILNEPTAAALAYGLNNRDMNTRVAVLDLGSGTFDITILEMAHGVFNVLSTSGDTSLGGKDMDDVILDYLVEEIERRHSVDLRHDPLSTSMLRDAAEEAKIQLSQSHRTLFAPKLVVGGEELRPKLILTRRRLEQLIRGVVDRMEKPIIRALEDSGMTAEEIDKLVLVGGPTKMPMVQRRIREIFGGKLQEVIDPMSVVATGAFIQASMLKGEIRDMFLLDVIPLSIGIETSGGVFTRMIKRNTAIPVEERRVFATNEDGQASMMIHVLQGEREMVWGNTSLGLFEVKGIPSARRFEQEVEVTFRVDANGILTVSAEVLETGKKASTTIRSVKELTEDDLTRMIIDATRFDAQDSKMKEIVQIRQNAAALLYGARDAICSLRGILSEDEERGFVETLDKLELSLLGMDRREIAIKMDELNEMIENLSAKAKIHSAKRLISSTFGTIDDSAEGREPISVTGSCSYSPSKYDIEAEMRRLKEALLLFEADGRT